MTIGDRRADSETGLRIIFVGGWMRSGTTLLCQMIWAFRHVLPVGELSGIWRAADREEPCSCGTTILDCPVWAPALEAVRAQHGITRGDYAEWAGRARVIFETRSAWSLARLSPGEPESWPPHVREYVEVMDTLLCSVRDTTEAVALIDSSKLAPSYLLHRLLPGARVDLLHIVRDPRAVANSGRKTRIRSGPSADLLPPGRSALYSILFWSGFNLSVRLFARSVSSYRMIDYATLTRRPDIQLDELARHLEIERIPGLVLDQGHIAVGNPARLVGPGKSVVGDESWKVELPLRTRWGVAVASLPVRTILRISTPRQSSRATDTSTEPKVLIDASNLHGGGGVQVAASFLDELATCMTSTEMMTAHPWLRSVDVELSSAVSHNIEPATMTTLHAVVVDRGPRHVASRRSQHYDVSFVIFGPEYGRGRASKRVVGFADSTVLHPRPPGVRRPSILRRSIISVRTRVSRHLFGTADVLVVETKRTAADLRRCLSLPPDRVRVVANTVNGIFDFPDLWGPPVLRPAAAENAYLLAYITRAYPHKNLEVLGAVGQIAQSRFGLKVVFLLTLNDQEWGALSDETRRHSVNLGPVPVTQVPYVYQVADAAIFPSLLESFSAMPIEAHKAGKVVFASDRGFVRTSCGEAPIYIEPLDALAMATVLARSLPDTDLMRHHQALGDQVAADLPTARDRALAYLDIIKDMLPASVTSPPDLPRQRN